MKITHVWTSCMPTSGDHNLPFTSCVLQVQHGCSGDSMLWLLLPLGFLSVLRLLLFHDLFTVVLYMLPIPDIFVYLLLKIVVIIVCILLLVGQLDTYIGRRLCEQLLLISVIVHLDCPTSAIGVIQV